MVVFPAPFGPKKPKIWPAGTVRFILLTARTFLKSRVRFSVQIASYPAIFKSSFIFTFLGFAACVSGISSYLLRIPEWGNFEMCQKKRLRVTIFREARRD